MKLDKSMMQVIKMLTTSRSCSINSPHVVISHKKVLIMY